MSRQRIAGVFILVLILFISNCARILRVGPPDEQKLRKLAHRKIERCIRENISVDYQGPVPAHTAIDTILVDTDSLRLDLHLSKHFSYQPFRPKDIDVIYQLFQNCLGGRFDNFELSIYSMEIPVEDFVPNFFRADTSDYDHARMPEITIRQKPPVIQNLHKKRWQPTAGLFNRNIALWHSHGFYYSFEQHRWEWQRPRLFCTVEDLLPMSFTVPYLIPMLENAGANVFVPRERSLQTHEVVIDNDPSPGFVGSGEYRELNPSAWKQGGTGFGIGQPPYPANLNPFLQGSYRVCRADSVISAGVEYIPDIPEAGRYGVYIAYHHSEENAPDAHYTVHHLGGRTKFQVNQQIGGSTWLYLGDFKFKQGFYPDNGKVVLSNQSQFPGKKITADAVRFGGGMGNILRGGRISGYPRFAEGARYYLQYAGMPDTLVYHLNEDTTDYNDDYQSRGEYVNYLKGKPFGPNRNRDAEGLGIPIDLSLSFHTDAGINTADSAIGTLMIYSIMDAETLNVFPDSMSRLASRDLSDIMQTQIVDDIRLKCDPDWNRRALRDGDYSEVWRPNVPACLLELLSHQNFKDMQYALSPQFRFDVSRSIYKGMLKFIATQNQYDFVVQPLPVSHFEAYFSDFAEVTLRWQPVNDPMEPTAVVENYVVYTRIENLDFDNGTLVDTNQFVKNDLESGTIYSFKVTAVNDGGESFPSEILSVCWIDTSESPILIINGFDRVGPPEFVIQPDFKGFLPMFDPGVPDKYDFNFTGQQFDFDPDSKFRSNDAPGHGASQANRETEVRLGNTFDYSYIHGSAIRNFGYSFVSASDEAVMADSLYLEDFEIVDYILGEEKFLDFPKINLDYAPIIKNNHAYQLFPLEFQNQLMKYLEQGGNLFVSGAYVGSELFNPGADKLYTMLFAQNALRIKWQTDHAVVNGGFFSVDSFFMDPFQNFEFNTTHNPKIYTVDSPDAIDPAEGARTIFRYSENRFSAGTAYKGEYGVVVFGFPFETILGDQDRDQIMKSIISFFKTNNETALKE